MLRPTFELLSSHKSGSFHSKKSDAGKEEEKGISSQASVGQSKFLPSQSSSQHLSLQQELDERLSLNLQGAKKFENKAKSRALVSSKLKKLRSKRESSLEKEGSEKGIKSNLKKALENINEEENKETMPRSPMAREALKKEKKREKMAQKIKNYQSPTLQQMIYTYPKHFHKKSISLFFSKESESSQASNLWEVMINPDDPSTLLFRHLLFDVTLKPLKPVFMDMFDKEPTEQENKRQLIVKLHLQNEEKKFLHVLANKYNPIDHKFFYTKFGIVQKEDQQGLSDLFALQPPLDPGTSLGVKFVQMCSNYLYRNKTFVPFTRQLDRLHDILQKIKLFTTNSLPEYFDDSFNYGAISQRHQTLIRESLIMQRLFEILTEIVEFDEDRIRYSEESDFGSNSSWSGNAANQPSVPPEDIITLILDICILNISMHKENTKYVLIYLFPKHLLREKVFVPFSNQIMSLAQQIAQNIKPILGSVDGSLKIILKQLIFYMISDWKGKSSDKTEKKEIITTLRVFFKTLKEHGMKDLVRQVFSTLTITNTGESFHGSDTKPLPGNTSGRKYSTSDKADDAKHPPARKVIMFHKQPLQVDPDYVIPLLHSSLLQSEQQITSLDDSLNLGMTSARFKPHQIIEAFNKLDRDLLKRQLYLYANICECMSANYSQVQTHRICLLIREWEYFVEQTDQKNSPTYEQNHLVKAGLLRLLYTLLTVTDRSVVCNPKSVRFFADQEEEDISLRCEKTVLGTDFSNFNDEAVEEALTDFKVQLTEPQVSVHSGRAEDNNNSQTQRSMRSPKKRYVKARRGQIMRSRSTQQGKPVLGSVLLSSQDIETLFEVESLDFEENLDPYTLRESHVQFMKIINYFVSAGILQYQDDFKIARRTLALIIQAFHKYISVCAETEKEFEEKYTKLEDLGTKQLKDVAALLQESEGFQITSNKGGVSERNPAKSFPKISSLDLHILELQVKMKKQQILEGAFGKVRIQNQHPTLFRNFEILHTYLGLVNSCLHTKLVSKSQIKRLETEKKRIERRKTRELEEEAKSPKHKSGNFLTTPRKPPFGHGKKLSAGRRTSITADLPRGGNEPLNLRGSLSYDDTLQSKVMIEICSFFSNLLLVDYDRVLTEYTAILKTHFYTQNSTLSPKRLQPRPSDAKLQESMKESRNLSLSRKPRTGMNQLEEGSPQILEKQLERAGLRSEGGNSPIRELQRVSAAQSEKKQLDKAVESVSEKLIHNLFEGEEFNQTDLLSSVPNFRRESTVEVQKLLVTHQMKELDQQIEKDEFDLKKIPTFFLVGSDPGRRVVIIEALCEWFNTCKSQQLRKQIALLVPKLIYHKRDVMRALVNYFSLFDTIISEEKYISVLTNLSFFKLKLNELESWRSLLKDENEIEDAYFDSMTTEEILQHSRSIDGPTHKEKDITRLIESLRVIRDFLAESPIAGIHQLDQHQRDAQTTQEDFKHTDMTYSTPASTVPLSSANYSHYLNLGQLWLRETGGYKIILELLIKATNIRTKALRMIYDVFKYDEQRRPPQITLKAIQLFTMAADIITLFIRQNSKNKALITKHICELVPFFGEEFIVGQIYEGSLHARQLNGATIRMLKEAVTDNPMLAGEERLVYSFIDALNTRLNKNKLVNLLVLFTGIIGSTHDPTIAEYSISYLMEKRSLKDLGADQGLLFNEVNPYLQRLRNIISGNQFKYAIEKYNALVSQLHKTLAMNNRRFQPSSSFQDYHQDDHGYLSLRNIPGVKLEETAEPEPQLTKSNREYLQGSSLFFETTDPVGPTPPLLQLLPVEESPVRQELPPSQQILVVNESRYNILQRIRSYILISSEVKNKIEDQEKEIFSRLFGNPCDDKKEMNAKERRKILQTKKRRQHIVADFISYIKKQVEVMEDQNDPESLMIPQDHSGVKLGLSLLSTIFDNFTSKKMGMLNLLLIELLVKMLNASSIPSVNPLMAQVLHFANILVGDGDQQIQSKFYECFKKTEGNQHFGYINSLIERAIHSLNSGSSKAILAKRQTPFEFVIDENYQACFFLKSLCEGHHQEFQAFLTDQQTNSNNFDMISLTVKYLASLITRVKGKIEEKLRTLKAIVDLSKIPMRGRDSNRRHGVNMIPKKIAKVDELSEDQKAYIFKNAKMCLVALTEFVQGPCFPNQLRVVEADYLRCARIILRDLHFTFDNHPTSHGLSNLQVLLLKSDVSELLRQCVLCLLSLIEQRGPNDVLLKAIRSQIKLSNIEHHIVYCYFAFDQLMGGKFISNEQYFGTENEDEDEQMYTLEPAFNFFVFALKMNEVENKLDKKYKPKGLFQHTTIKKDVLRHSVIGSLINFIQDAKDTRVDQSTRPKTLDQLSEHTFKSNFYTYEREAGVFFAKHTAKIQILNNGNLEEIYFPRAPSYKNLNAEQKQNFVYSLELEKDQVQMDSVIEQGDALIDRLRGEYKFKKFFQKYGLLGVVLFYSNLWKTLGYYLTLLINFFIFVSYTSELGTDRFTPRLFLTLSTFWTQVIFDFLGFMMLALAVSGNFLLISNRLPQHFNNVFKREAGSRKINHDIQIKDLSKSQLLLGSISLFWLIITDMQLLYDILYVVCAILGLFLSHIFYSFHVLDIIVRSPLLVNILKSLWRPRRELLLTLVLFLVIEYLFTTFAYWYFGKDYPLNECISIISCFMTNVDQTFKNDGGIGAYMEMKVENEREMYDSSSDIPFSRILFDQLFNLMLVILIVQIIAAIMIDTFGALRDETSTIRELITTSCIVCGKTRDEIERDEDNFDNHVHKEHNLFNYIMFLAYLKRKSKIDLTGSESYVWEMYQDEDPRWFPIYQRRVGGKKKDDDDDEYSDYNRMNCLEQKVDQNTEILQKVLGKLEQMESTDKK